MAIFFAGWRAVSDFGNVIDKTPFFSVALTFAASTSQGRGTCRWKVAYARSMRWTFLPFSSFFFFALAGDHHASVSQADVDILAVDSRSVQDKFDCVIGLADVELCGEGECLSAIGATKCGQRRNIAAEKVVHLCFQLGKAIIAAQLSEWLARCAVFLLLQARPFSAPQPK